MLVKGLGKIVSKAEINTSQREQELIFHMCGTKRIGTIREETTVA